MLKETELVYGDFDKLESEVWNAFFRSEDYDALEEYIILTIDSYINIYRVFYN